MDAADAMVAYRTYPHIDMRATGARAAALLDQHPQPTREQVVHALEGNHCRCGVQGRVVRAVLDASLCAP